MEIDFDESNLKVNLKEINFKLFPQNLNYSPINLEFYIHGPFRAEKQMLQPLAEY